MGIQGRQQRTRIVQRTACVREQDVYKRQVIDITDYYNNMVSSGVNHDPQLNLLIGLRGAPMQIGYDETKAMVGNVATTFDRLVIDELPILRIYYANYK